MPKLAIKAERTLTVGKGAYALSGHRYRIVGALAPMMPGEHVTLQVFHDGKRKRAQKIALAADGTFRLKVKAGKARRVLVHRAVSPGTEAGAPGGLCTLRAAVMESNASVWKDTIEVPSGLYQLTLPVAAGGGRLAITDGVKIQGAGAATTIIEGNHADFVIYVQSEGLELNNFTVQGGLSDGGGGIRVDAGTSEFNNLVIRQNEAFTGGGGLAIDSGATLRMRRSAIIDNMATGAFGGGIWNKGELWVYDSTIANNDSNRAGGIRNEGHMNLRNVTVSGNIAHSDEAGTGGISQNGFAVCIT